MTSSQRHYVEDTVAAIRLRTRHHDPYEEWERKTRKDAFHNARRELALAREKQNTERSEARVQEIEAQTAKLAQEMSQMAVSVAEIHAKAKTLGERLAATRREKDNSRKQRIEAVIRAEEEKARQRLEEQRKAREEEERKRKEAELRARLEEQKRLQEVEKKRKEEEEERLKRQKEEEEKKELEKLEEARAAELNKQSEERKTLGMTTPAEDWQTARQTLTELKAGPMRTVKGDRDLKKIWSESRRKITPKVGQLTNDKSAIANISQQILNILQPNPPLPPVVYYATLSSLSKIILMQAETEVTAEKRSALPLASLTVNLMSALPSFESVFWAKLVQRTGGWCIPTMAPSKDIDGTPFSEAEYKKARGYQDGESISDYVARIAGIMRVYFAILHQPAPKALDRMFQLPRFWAYFARTVSQPSLLKSATSTELLSVALDVGGVHAKNVWGQQWIKMLALLYEGVTTGVGGASIGGTSKAAQVRLQLEIERVMSS
ncbi:hypothetical protein FA95DRAFT_898238 [Auriscalpium vulgare]|uniref:Uncharacterized protein n=1 Tax=Auriscalpium vulgare TaxID=40419 RepID=A0ACB8RYM0_9AGAM|nr:hypothetical protein FA95DRAFT_898238 [Auriscalpium vulgare]